MRLLNGPAATLLNVPGGWAVTPTSNLVESVGDSISVASQNTAGAGITTQTLFQPRLQNTSGSVGGFMTWASILPKTGASYGDGRLQFNGVHATSGNTIAQIKTTHIDGADSPLNSSPKPGIVVVLAGTNDLGSISPAGVVDASALATRLASLSSIYTTLIAAGILPLACAVPPNNTANNQPGVTALNAGIQALAASLRIPYADLWTPCASGNNWAANYHSGDGIHPSVTGAKAMGQAVRDALETILPATAPVTLVTTATDGTSLGNLYENGANQVVGSTAGVPKGGSPAANAYWSWTAAGTTPTLESRSGYNGIAWVWDKTSDASGDTTASGSSAGNGVFSLTDGNSYDLAFITEVVSWAQDDMSWTVSLRKITDASKRIDLILNRDANFSSAIAPFAWSHRLKCNATTLPAGTYRLLLTLGDGATTTNATGKIAIGQITLRDLGAI